MPTVFSLSNNGCNFFQSELENPGFFFQERKEFFFSDKDLFKLRIVIFVNLHFLISIFLWKKINFSRNPIDKLSIHENINYQLEIVVFSVESLFRSVLLK